MLLIRCKEVEKSSFEVVGVERFLQPRGEIMRDEFVPGLLANELFQVVEEVETL
jgi:hypothetical protein